MRRSRDFLAAVRSGQRTRCATVVLHLGVGSADEPSRVGLVVSKAVGSSVVRHRVARRLRAVVASRLRNWPDGQLVVVRALPAAAFASSATIAADVDAAWRRLPANRAVR